jgi:lantibiotic biosynthesis dehydratase-like protein
MVVAKTPEEVSKQWLSGHLYYHENLDRAVQGFVHPLVATLARDGSITGFFFIRHGLGGPHIRLRLRPVAGAGERVLDEMERFALTFLAREPSTHSQEGDAIRRSNTAILKADPHEVDDSVYPDNSYHLVPFRPEIERYGGPGRFHLSLDYFTLSSVAAVDFHFRLGGVARSVQLAQAYGLLLRQALGFAISGDELTDLLRYGVDWLGQDLPKVVEKGDNVARSQMELFLQLLFSSLDEARTVRAQADVSDLSPPGLLVVGAGRLSAAVGPAEHGSRLRIGASQLHMTASRLGLTHAEEVYLSRILTRTLGEACSGWGTDLSWIREIAVGKTSEDPVSALRQLLPHALAALAAFPGMSADRG